MKKCCVSGDLVQCGKVFAKGRKCPSWGVSFFFPNGSPIEIPIDGGPDWAQIWGIPLFGVFFLQNGVRNRSMLENLGQNMENGRISCISQIISLRNAAKTQDVWHFRVGNVKKWCNFPQILLFSMKKRLGFAQNGLFWLDNCGRTRVPQPGGQSHP